MPTSNRFYEIEKKALDFIAANELIFEGDKILIALSGGADSMFALHVLHKFSQRLNITVEAAHVNHLIRGKESDMDESFCSDICEKLGVKFYSKRIDIPLLKQQSNDSIEEIARRERYKYLIGLTQQYGFNKIVTAHNKNDNVETVLLNLIKGTGLSGLAGIPVRRENIIRPFLSINKSEILDYLETHKLSYRSDLSNESLEFERNYIRKKLIPQIEKSLNPKVVSAVAQTSTNLRMFHKMTQKLVDETWEKFIITNQQTYGINLDLFEFVDEALIGEVLKKLVTEKLGFDFSSRTFNNLLELARNQVGKKISLANGFVAVREREMIKIFIPDSTNEIFIEFKLGQTVKTESLEISAELVDVSDYKNTTKDVFEFISADNLDDIFILRNWKMGDRFVPLGMNGHKNVSDYLTDRKIPNATKNEICILMNRG